MTFQKSQTALSSPSGDATKPADPSDARHAPRQVIAQEETSRANPLGDNALRDTEFSSFSFEVPQGLESCLRNISTSAARVVSHLQNLSEELASFGVKVVNFSREGIRDLVQHPVKFTAEAIESALGLAVLVLDPQLPGTKGRLSETKTMMKLSAAFHNLVERVAIPSSVRAEMEEHNASAQKSLLPTPQEVVVTQEFPNSSATPHLKK